MTLSQTHTHIYTHGFGCLCNPRTSCLLCLPVFHDQFILSACSFPSSPTTPPPLLSVFPLPVVTLFLSMPFLLLFFFFHLTPYFSLICPPFPPANPFTPSLPSDHPSPHYLSGCSPLLPLAHSPSPFYTFFSCHRPPVGFVTLLLHLSFYSIPGACALIPCLFSLSHF